jgi:acetyl-CoA/propionyl-CoA carboxylase biotin carboxyl carrier protein
MRLTADADPATVRVRGTIAAARVAVDDGDETAASASIVDEHTVRVTHDGRTRCYAIAEDGATVWIGFEGDAWMLRQHEQLDFVGHSEAEGGPVVAPMPGTVTAVQVGDGARVTAGQTLMVMEAMKMEHRVTAPVDGVVSGLSVSVGDQITMAQVLLTVQTADERS